MAIDDLSEDEVFANDLDPMEAIAEIRREEEKADDDGEKTPTPDEETPTEEPKKVDETPTETPDDDGSETPANKEIPAEEEETPPGKEEVAKVVEAVKKKFKANGQEFEFTDQEILDQFEGVFGKAMNFTQKMQNIAPYRKMISALEEEGLTEADLNLAIDALKGDKGAIKTIADKKNIDLNDLGFEDGKTDYQPNVYGKDEVTQQISDIEEQISSDPEFPTTVDIIDKQWDDASRKTVQDNPDYILGLHADVKSGVYAKVAPEATKLQMLDGNSKSSLEYYILAGANMKESTDSENPQKKVDDLNKSGQDAEEKFNKESSEAEAKRLAGSNGSTAGKKGVVDYLDDDDEKFDAWYKALEAKN